MITLWPERQGMGYKHVIVDCNVLGPGMEGIGSPRALTLQKLVRFG
jgi:hypothetical protein